MRSRRAIPTLLLLCLAALLAFVSCKRGGRIIHGDPAYVSAPQVNLRDRLSAIYNKVGVVKNGERVEILEKSKRFVRVRSPRGEEGWIEARYLVGPEIFDALEKLAQENRNAPVQGHGLSRAELKLHVTPGRSTDALFRIEDGAKLELLKRGTAEKPQTKAQPEKDPSGKDQPPAAPPQEDWWLVRDAQQQVGWVLARMVDVDVPLDVAQYAEGQRIMAAFVLNQVPDTDPATGTTRQVPQYVLLLNEPKDGTPWDFNQLRVFSWNARRHRYETAYRERNLFGIFPLTVSHEVFDREGDLPVFVMHVKDESGNIVARKYKMNQPMVRRVLSPEEQRQIDEQKAARIAARPRSAKPSATGRHR